MALASALEKLAAATAATRSITRGAAHLCIVDPSPGLLSSREGFLADVLASHPPIRQRIIRLEGMGYQQAKRRPPSDSPCATRSWLRRPSCASLVHRIWLLRGDAGGRARRPFQRAMPDGRAELIFNLADPFECRDGDGVRRQPLALLVGPNRRAM